MLITASAAMFFSVFGLFLDSIGLSLKRIGIIGGLSEGFGYLFKIVSGVLSDFLRRRKLIFALGSILTTISKPISAIFMTQFSVIVARILDRVGNGLQATPRDALVGEYAPKAMEGTCFGIRQCLGTLGSVVGVLIVGSLLRHFSNGYQVVFIVSSTLGALAFLSIVFFVHDRPQEELEPTAEEALVEKIEGTQSIEAEETLAAPEGGLEALRTKAASRKRKKASAFHLRDILLLPRAYWVLMVVVAVFMLGRMSESLITLYGKKLFALEDASAIRIILLYNITSAVAAYLTGRAAQRFSSTSVMLAGALVMMLSNLAMKFAGNVGGYPLFMAGVVLWGIQIGLMQNVFCAEISAMIEPKLKGTAFGIFYFITAVSVYGANQVSGALMDHGSGAFLYSACISLITCFLIGLVKRHRA